MDKMPKILYVDDEMINLQLFEINLRKKFDVFITDNVMKGFELLEKNPDVSIVVSDMRMPVMNGLEFIKKSKNMFPKISYFMLSGYEITDEIQQAINSGLIIRYFRKPFNMSEMISVFDDVIKDKINSAK